MLTENIICIFHCWWN